LDESTPARNLYAGLGFVTNNNCTLNFFQTNYGGNRDFCGFDNFTLGQVPRGLKATCERAHE
jgi:hypothetical protein